MKIRLRSHLSASLAAALVYLLLLGADRLLDGLDLGVSAYLWAAGGVQLCVYGLPVLIYGLLFGLPHRRLRLCRPAAVGTVSAVLLCGILLCGSALLSMIGVRIGWSSPAVQETGVYAPLLPQLVTFVLLPAICEEFLFRGVILSAFEPCGIGNAIVGTSVLFALSHMNLSGLPIYFFCSVILCFSAYVTRSLYVPMLLHALYNAFSRYAGDAMRAVAAHLESFSLLVLALSLLLGLLVLLALAESARVYRHFAARGADSDYVPEKTDWIGRLKRGAALYFSVPFLLCVLIYAAAVILE